MKGLKKIVLSVALLSGVLLGLAPQASALTFDLNCSFSGGACSGSGTFGTVTITDTVTVGTVQVVVDTSAMSSTSKDLQVALNSTVAVTSTSLGTLTYSPNSLTVNGSGNYGAFDLTVQFNGTSSFTPVTFSLSGTGLTANSFNTADAGGIFAAVHVGNINTAGQSLAVGANGQSLPLPATMLLMGASFLGLGVARRFKK